MDEPIVMELYTVAVFNLRTGMKKYNACPFQGR